MPSEDYLDTGFNLKNFNSGRVKISVERALRESLKLQSHYAELLNMHDGGQRMTFSTNEEWLNRLESLR